MIPAECGQCGGPVDEDGFAAEVCPWGPTLAAGVGLATAIGAAR